MQRRELLAKILKPVAPGALEQEGQRAKFIPPPYFGSNFECEGCEAPCVSVCGRNLLKFEGEKVKFELDKRGCNLCKECAIACEQNGSQTLNLANEAKILARTTIEVNSCLAWNDVVCYSCQDVCKFRAITYLGMFRPIINERCISCGECVAACFKNSIKMEAL